MTNEPPSEWNAAQFATGLRRFEMGELVDPARRLEWLDAVASFGAAVVTGVPTTYDGLRAVSDLVGIVHNTNYGVVWDILAKNEPDTLVDSEHPLRVHTDLPYRRLPPGLQFLLAAEAGADGGETLLVDGYALARSLEASDPDAHRNLHTQDRAFAYINDHQRYIGGGPIIGRASDGTPDVIRHAPDLVLSMREEAHQADADRALGLFVDLAASAEFEARLRLEPVELLVFNNHRVLHGRGHVDLSSGRRRLLGCYGSLDELASTRRVLSRVAR